jgi:hypothetical protein
MLKIISILLPPVITIFVLGYLIYCDIQATSQGVKK